MSTRSMAGALLCLSVIYGAGASEALDRSRANSLWVAETEGAIWLASSDGSIRTEISGFTNVRAAAVDVRREIVWLLGDGLLAAFDLSGGLRLSVPLDVSDSPFADLAVVPSTGAVWAGVQETLLNVGPDGQLLGSHELGAKAVTLAVDEGASTLWAGTQRGAEARDLITGELVGRLPLPADERLRDLSLAPEGGRLWIVSGASVRLHEPSGEVVLERAVPGVVRIAAAPGETAWLATRKEIVHLGQGSTLGPPLAPLERKGTLEHLVVSGEGTVWAASQTAVARLAADGSVLDRISFRPPIRIWDLTTNTDALAPVLEMLAPAEGACLNDATPSIELEYSDRGWGVDPSSLEIFADAEAIATSCTTAAQSATCRPLDPLLDGERRLGAAVADHAGNRSTPAERQVVVDTGVPQILVAEPVDGVVVAEPEVTISGTVSEPVELTVAGFPVALSEALGFSHGPLTLTEGANTIDLVAVDCAGNTARTTLTVHHQPGSSGGLPPDPATVAPPLDPTVPTEIHDGSRFLYEGPTPIQLEADPEAIDPTRVVVVRGSVFTRDGEPLSGVRVSVEHHGEYGYTLSREDGAFDLVANGGARLTLEYSKAGHLSAHRPVQAPWRDFVIAEDVVLLPYDENATAVTLGSAEAQVARGSVSVDQDGARQATVILPAGTQAELIRADGSRQPVSSLTVRATEYTVGPRGPEAMPAPLPPTSGYTYAVELSADEAIAVGARAVVFSEPVYHYVENFLGFAVGSVVPAGYYDREAGVWIPSQNGRVIEVLEIVEGRAVVDVDGTGLPASAADLEALALSDGELLRLAELYAPATTLWRTPIPHFTPWDCNWPYGPPDDAEEPPEPDAEKPDPQDEESDEAQDDDEPAEDEDDPACEQGSVIECENQVLGEEIPLVGTSQSLHYRSNRVPGRRVADTFKVRLSGRRVPASLKRIELRIDIAGQRIRRTFAPAPNRSYTFTWDRTDAYGRAVQGRHPATAHVGYVYKAVYYEPAEIPNAFAAISSRSAVTIDRAAFEVVSWRSSQKLLGASDATMAGLGGWTLTDHHVYQPATYSRELHYGHGDKQVQDEPASYQVAWDPAEDTTGIPGRRLLGPYWLVGAPDGGFYFVDGIPRGFAAPVFRVWKANADGQKERAVYVTTRLDIPEVVLGPGGDVYVGTCDNLVWGKIENLRTGETWSTFGTGCFDQFLVAPDGSIYHGRSELKHRRRDGSTTTVFRPPSLREMGFRTIDDQGRIFVAVRYTHRVWRVDPDGSARVVAGTGVSGFSGDGGPADLAQLNFPQELEIAPDGSLLILDAFNHRVRRVSRSGTIHTVLGSGSSRATPGPIAPLAAGLSFTNYLGVTPDGRILVQDWLASSRAILQLSYPLPRFTPLGTTTIVSKDGDEVLVFDSRGRHLRTLHALTGAVVRTFGYDGGGRLASVTDAFGNATRIERDASGTPEAIVAPFGQRTELEVDADGYLASVTNPAGEAHRLVYGAGGLLRSFTDPAGHADTFEYSPLGRLVAARDAAGGVKTLRRWVSGAGRYRIALTTVEGQETSYSLRRETGGTVRREISRAGGTTVEIVTGRDGSRRADLASGTSVRSAEGADPRFGLQAPLVASRQVTTPSGLSLLSSFEREATLSSSGDPFSVAIVRANLIVNGRQGFELYDAATREVTITSPMGRTAVRALDEHLRPSALRSPGVEEVRFEFSPRGALSRVAQGGGAEERVLTLSYDERGRVASRIDPLQREVRFEYDEADRVVRQIQPDGRAIRFEYDPTGNLTAVVPPGQPPHLFRYTPVDAVEAYEPPELDMTSPGIVYSYDRDQRLIAVVRPDGKSVGFTYDSAGRVEALAHPRGTLNLDYDPDTGQLASVADGGATISYSYDGDLLARTHWSGAVQGTVTRGYDDDFWLRSLSVNGEPITFDYDEDGLLTRAGGLTVAREAASGRIIRTSLGSLETNSSYDAFGELKSLDTATEGISLHAVDFKRDRMGRIETKTETIAGVTLVYEYGYDTSGRLARVLRNGSLIEKYRYDDNGNRVVATYPWGELIATHDDQDRLLTYGGTTYTYSPAGDLTSRTDTGATTAYDYDVFGNLQRVELPQGHVIEYLVDGLNRRIGRKLNGALVQGFLYEDVLNPVAELDAAGAVVARFVYGTRAHVPDYLVKDGKTYRLISDHLGSVRLVVEAETGVIEQRLDYDSFGRTILDTNPGFQPFGFAGGIYDPLTGLVRFGARDYDPHAGRWTAKEPILFIGGDTNLYAYVFNDPLNWLDPTGLEGRPEGYATVGIALVAAFGEIVNKSPAELQWEWGGVIFQDPNGNYNYTGPVTEKDPFQTIFPGGPAECEDLAVYHNHPDHPEAVNPEIFSPADRGLAKQGLDVYLLTPSNTLFKLSPAGEVSRIGRFPGGGN